LIETERLTVRLPQAADIPEIVGYYGNNREHLQPFSPTFAPDFLDETKWQEQVRRRTKEPVNPSARFCSPERRLTGSPATST